MAHNLKERAGKRQGANRQPDRPVPRIEGTAATGFSDEQEQKQEQEEGDPLMAGERGLRGSRPEDRGGIRGPILLLMLLLPLTLAPEPLGPSRAPERHPPGLPHPLTLLLRPLC